MRTSSKKAFFSKNCSFSNLKYTIENILFCNACKEKNSIKFHINLVLTDEKPFITADLLKLRVRRESFTGEVPGLLHCHHSSARKRHNKICSTRPLRMMLYNKMSQCTVSEEVGNTDVCQKCLLLNVRTGFLKKKTC